MSGADNSAKTPLTATLPTLADVFARKVVSRVGQTLPCHVTKVAGSIVTVAFDVQDTWTRPPVTMPLFGPEYIRYPIQVGDKGIAVSADALIGVASGLGGTVNDTHQPGNLSALTFLPVGNTKFSAANVSATQTVVYGPDGVMLRDAESRCIFNLTPDGITITIGNVVMTLAANGNIGITTTGTITLQGSVVTINP